MSFSTVRQLFKGAFDAKEESITLTRRTNFIVRIFPPEQLGPLNPFLSFAVAVDTLKCSRRGGHLTSMYDIDPPNTFATDPLLRIVKAERWP